MLDQHIGAGRDVVAVNRRALRRQDARDIGEVFDRNRQARQQPALATLPLVVYSGREISDTEMAKLRLGPTEFLTKAKVQPKEVEELVLSMVHHIRTQFTDLATAGPAV